MILANPCSVQWLLWSYQSEALCVDACNLSFSASSSGGDRAWYLEFKRKFLGAYTEDSRIWGVGKLFSSRIHWVSGWVMRAEVTCVTLFPFSQARPALSFKTKTHKSAPGKYDFFSHFTKLSKCLGWPVLLLTCKTLHTAPAQLGIEWPTSCISFHRTVDLLLEKMACTSDRACEVWKNRGPGFCRDDLHVSLGLKEQKHVVSICVGMPVCVDWHKHLASWTWVTFSPACCIWHSCQTILYQLWDLGCEVWSHCLWDNMT